MLGLRLGPDKLIEAALGREVQCRVAHLIRRLGQVCQTEKPMGKLGVYTCGTPNPKLDYEGDIRWMEEILHQLVYGLSPYNPIIYNVSELPNGCQLVQDFFHPQYGRHLWKKNTWWNDVKYQVWAEIIPKHLLWSHLKVRNFIVNGVEIDTEYWNQSNGWECRECCRKITFSGTIAGLPHSVNRFWHLPRHNETPSRILSGNWRSKNVLVWKWTTPKWFTRRFPTMIILVSLPQSPYFWTNLSWYGCWYNCIPLYLY